MQLILLRIREKVKKERERNLTGQTKSTPKIRLKKEKRLRRKWGRFVTWDRSLLKVSIRNIGLENVTFHLGPLSETVEKKS